MRGALAAPLLLATTFSFVAADNLGIFDVNDGVDIMKDTELYSEDTSASFYKNFETNIVSKAVEEESPNPSNAHRRNGFFYATECYSCVGCNEVSELQDLKTCPYTPDISKQNKCIVYVEKYNNFDYPWYIRGCASERYSCAEIKEVYSTHKGIVSIESCVECEGDRCNKSCLSCSVSFTSIAFFVIIAPLITKYTLS